MTNRLGCGNWSVYLTERGGGQPLVEIPHGSISLSHLVDESGSASISVPVTGQNRSACCEALNLAEPWRHEIIAYRDRDVAFVGPLIGVEVSAEGGQLNAQDLFFWMERRFIEDDAFFSADASEVFEEIFNLAYDPDPSPNITVIAHKADVEVERRVHGKEFQRASDLLRELARTAVDFTMVDRQLIVGGKEVFEPGIGPGVPLIIHDDGVSRASVNKDGNQFATDVATFGEAVAQGQSQRIHGRATRSQDVYGLIQRSFAELLITDTPSANENALSRLLQMQPVPHRGTMTLSQEAAFGYEDLIPGRRCDVRITRAAGCVELVDTMRLTSVSTEVSRSESGDTESVTVEVVPLGLTEIA